MRLQSLILLGLLCAFGQTGAIASTKVVLCQAHLNAGKYPSVSKIEEFYQWASQIMPVPKTLKLKFVSDDQPARMFFRDDGKELRNITQISRDVFTIQARDPEANAAKNQLEFANLIHEMGHTLFYSALLPRVPAYNAAVRKFETEGLALERQVTAMDAELESLMDEVFKDGDVNQAAQAKYNKLETRLEPLSNQLTVLEKESLQVHRLTFALQEVFADAVAVIYSDNLDAMRAASRLNGELDWKAEQNKTRISRMQAVNRMRDLGMLGMLGMDDESREFKAPNTASASIDLMDFETAQVVDQLSLARSFDPDAPAPQEIVPFGTHEALWQLRRKIGKRVLTLKAEGNYSPAAFLAEVADLIVHELNLTVDTQGQAL